MSRSVDPRTQTSLGAYQYPSLTDAEREVYRSVEEQGLRPVDIARDSDWTPSTVRTLLGRARKKVGGE